MVCVVGPSSTSESNALHSSASKTWSTLNCYDVTPSDTYSVQAPSGGVIDCFQHCYFFLILQNESVDHTALSETSTIAPVISSAAPVVETTLVASPTGILLTAKKRVGPLPARRLAWRHASPRSSDHHPYSFSHLRILRQFILRLLVVAAPLSTLYPPTTSESSSRHAHNTPASSSHSARPSRKRYSYSSEASIEEDTEIDPIETKVDMELGIGDGDDVRDHVEIDPRDVRDDTEEYESDTNAGDTIKVRIDRIVGIETAQRRLEADQLIASDREDHVNSLRLHMSLSQKEFRQVRRDHDDTRGRLRRTMTNTRSGMTPAAIEEMINQRVDAALEARRVNQDLELGNGNENGNGNGNVKWECEIGTGNGNNGGDNGDGNENHNVNRRGDRPVARKCTYQDFMKCQPLSFQGTEGVVGLIRWSEKMETVFHISNCPERYQVKYATCTLLDSALTWWNSHKRTIGTDAACTLSWRELLKLMTEVYCLRNEIQKMETELWNLSVKNNDMATYT
ncbi:putative reverse transcriptase domain-containing protein [Tanacetum coccineum]